MVTSVGDGFVVLCWLTSALLLELFRVRKSSISGQHLLDPRLCGCQVGKLIHLQLVREILGICGVGGLTGQLLGLLNVVCILGARLSEPHVQRNRELLPFICARCLLGCQVALLLIEKLIGTVGVMLVDFTHPHLHIYERFLVCDIIDYDDVVCALL